MSKNHKHKVDFGIALNSLNDNLFNSQKELLNTIDTDQTSVHIIGAPRSGTTLLSQLLISNTDIGYINNFIASFWKAPLYGIHYSNKLLPSSFTSSLKSNFGSTNSIQEPHEFSYFWKYHLNYPDFLQKTYQDDHTVNWISLKEILYQMVFAYNKPILFKSFQYGFHADQAVAKMPKTVFIHIKRDLYQNAFSILKLREKMNGNTQEWASIKPHQYSFLKNENIFRQVIGQVLFLNYEYEKQLENIPLQNKISLSYKELCHNSKKNINAVVKLISKHSPLDFYDQQQTNISERSVTIPSEILKQFKEAKQWALTNYPELSNND